VLRWSALRAEAPPIILCVDSFIMGTIELSNDQFAPSVASQLR